MVNNVPTLSNLEGVFSSVLSILLGLAAITFFILLLSSGFKFITSGGDPKAVEGAKKTLTYAIGGLILIIASYLILLLIQEITKVNVTNFVIFQQP
jgi:hypothetical protein